MKTIKYIILAFCLCCLSITTNAQAVKTAEKVVAKYGAKTAGRTASKAAAKAFAQTAREKAMMTLPRVSTRIARQEIKGLGSTVAKHSVWKIFGLAARNESVKEGEHFATNAAINSVKYTTSNNALKASTRAISTANKTAGNTAKRQLKKSISSNKVADAEINRLRQSNSFFTNQDFKVNQLKNGNTEVSYPGHSTKATFSKDGKVIEASGGSRLDSYSRNEFLAKPLPNKTYKVDKFAKYKTDKLGRTTDVECDETALLNLSNQNKVVRADRPSFKDLVEEGGVSNSTHDGGHLISYANNGPHEKLNVIPMENSWQRHGEWAKFEKFRQDVAKNGQKVFTKMKISYYDDMPSIPKEIKVDCWIDGKLVQKVFPHPHP